MAILNLLRPSRWRSVVGAALDMKLQNSRAVLLAALEQRLAENHKQIMELVVERVAEVREETACLRRVLLDQEDEEALQRFRSAASEVRKGLSALKNEIAAQLGLGLYDMATQVTEQRQWLERMHAHLTMLGTKLDNQQNWLEKISFETANQLTHLDTSLNTRLNTLESRHIDGLIEQLHEATGAQVGAEARQADRSAWCAQPDERYAPADPEPLDHYLARAEREFPRVYGLWRERLDATAAALAETKVGNAAFAGDLHSRIFRAFVATHARGRVLDVGCGPFGRPFYLRDYPASLVSGLEPLAMREAADFEVVQGIGEYLPWPDGSFSTVISATALDHCLSLRRCLAEMIRVLRPGGCVLLWIGATPGAPAYDPDSPDFRPSDQFHLFHFDTSWFDPLLEEAFDPVDRLDFKMPAGYSHVFYCLRARQRR